MTLAQTRNFLCDLGLPGSAHSTPGLKTTNCTWAFRRSYKKCVVQCPEGSGGTRDALRHPVPVDPVRADNNRQLLEARIEVKPASVFDLATCCGGAAAAAVSEHDRSSPASLAGAGAALLRASCSGYSCSGSATGPGGQVKHACGFNLVSSL